MISPNLIPQVGPTGGGDGKTDSETYPVSNFISDRWFISGNRWGEKENWAFAISAKTDWKTKLRSDVNKIIGTNRGYTKIFFFSSQKISSKKKKEVQDELKKAYDIELIVLDAEWIVEKVYHNSLLNDVIECLNLSRIYLEEKITGPNDTERQARLLALEEKISSSDRDYEVDFQLVEDCLDSAITSRKLELSKTEVIGKFERAKRFANKLNNIQIKIRVHYQLAWTFINWYDDYKEFYSEYLGFKQLVWKEPNLSNIELYLNLFNILRTVSSIEEVKDHVTIDFKSEEDDFTSFLAKCSLSEDKLSTALLSKFYLSFIRISNNLDSSTIVSEELIKLKGYFEISKHHLDIPFEQLKQVIEVYGKLLPDNKEYDNLIDVIAELEAIRVSELSSGQIYLNRGVTKLQSNYNRESLIFFGKASRKLAKEETQSEFYFCLMLLSEAYSKLGLYWASYNALVSAANIYANNWFTTGNLNPRFIRSIENILKNEVIIGRVPVLLCWYELYNVVKRCLQDKDTSSREEIPTEHLTDACLAVRLLNAPFEAVSEYTYLPDILRNNELWLSSDAILYLLGNEDLIEIDEVKTSLTKEKLSDYYNKFANQPFVEQMAYDTNLLAKHEIILETQILGINLKIQTIANAGLMILSESILAYFESYLATSFEDAFPLSEKIILEISSSKIDTLFSFENKGKSAFQLVINESFPLKGKNIADIMNSILPQIIANNYVFKDYKSFFDNLYRNDEVGERLSIILEHKNFLTNILTSKPKFFLKDWKSDLVKNYKLNRESSPVFLNRESQRKPKRENREKPDFKYITHKNIKAETIIDAHLWDKAKWKAFGFFSMPSIPFGVFLSFENGDAGRKIFENWIKEYGKVDKDEIISLTVIKGIDKNHPNWYKVLVSKKVDKAKMKDGDIISSSSRFHRMEPEDNVNLTKLSAGFNHHRKYILVPTEIDKDFRVKPFFDLGILKTELKFINAWEIGLHDFERAAITKDDNPIIPDNIDDAPIIEVLKEKGI